MKNYMDLTGRVAIVTGASSGLGYAFSKALAENGAKVAALARRKEKLEVLKAEIEAAGGECFPVVCDVTKESDIIAAVDQVAKHFGQIDILINNAGITKDTLLMRMTDEQFEDVINTNLRSCFKMCRAAIMPMMKNRYGRIINMASIIGVIGGAGQANYAASKGGMIAMTKSIAAEVASRGITANAIAPGFIKTPMTDVLPEELKKTYLAQIPSGRFGEPEDIANACVFLASEEASYINGQVLHINGGMGRF